MSRPILTIEQKMELWEKLQHETKIFSDESQPPHKRTEALRRFDALLEKAYEVVIGG